MAQNVKFSAPCAFGVDCHLHFRPTLRERTDGRWLHEGESSTEAARAPLYEKNLPSPSVDYRPRKAVQKNDAAMHIANSGTPTSGIDGIEDTDSASESSTKEKANNAVESLKQFEAEIRNKISKLESKYGRDLST